MRKFLLKIPTSSSSYAIFISVLFYVAIPLDLAVLIGQIVIKKKGMPDLKTKSSEKHNGQF